MDLLSAIREDLDKGFSKKQLEELIGLPKNCLSNILSGKKKLSLISELKVKKFMENPKPDPLTLSTINKKKSEPFKGMIPTLLEGKPVVFYPHENIPVTLNSLLKEIQNSMDNYEPQPQIRNAGLDKKLNEALKEMNVIPVPFQVILSLAKNGASQEEVEKKIASNQKLTPNQKEMIRSKIVKPE